MTKWQPIETAPTCGSRFDVWARNYDNRERKWLKRRFIDVYRGYRCGDDCAFIGVPPDWEPTHWQPFPPPPTEGEK